MAAQIVKKTQQVTVSIPTADVVSLAGLEGEWTLSDGGPSAFVHLQQDTPAEAAS